MSMAMVLDERALRIADDNGIFACASSYDEAVEREATPRNFVLDAKLNLGTMQHNFHDTDWRQVLPTVEHAALVPNSANFPIVPGHRLDIFYKEAGTLVGRRIPWSSSSIRPIEASAPTPLRRGRLNARPQNACSWPRTNFDGDGAPRYLLHAAEVLKRDHELLAWSFEREGPLRREFEHLGAEIIPSPTDEQRAQQRLELEGRDAQIGAGLHRYGRRRHRLQHSPLGQRHREQRRPRRAARGRGSCGFYMKWRSRSTACQ